MQINNILLLCLGANFCKYILDFQALAKAKMPSGFKNVLLHPKKFFSHTKHVVASTLYMYNIIVQTCMYNMNTIQNTRAALLTLMSL